MGKSKITNEQIEEIKKLYVPSKGGNNGGNHIKFAGSLSRLAKKYSVSIGAIFKIVRGVRKNNLTTLERFMQYVEKKDNSCWLWIGCVDTDGYGDFTCKEESSHRAHRVSWKLHKGNIPEGLFVLHSCDIPSCVNPEHLFLGTHEDNIKDKIKKGRCIRTLSKLTEQQVLEIRAKYQPRKGGRPKGWSTKEKECLGSIRQLAKEYNVSKAAIKKIIRNQTWKHI